MRRGGRVLVLDASGRVLLMGTAEPAFGRAMVWVPPGGGAHAGEDHRQAAARELGEETGLQLDARDLGEPVATHGNPEVDEAFFLVRVDSPFLPRGGDQDETEMLLWTEFRWWSSTEIRATNELVFPKGLADLLDAIVATGPPNPAWRLPWEP